MSYSQWLSIGAVVAAVIGYGCGGRERTSQLRAGTDRAERTQASVELTSQDGKTRLAYACQDRRTQASNEEQRDLVWDYAVWILRRGQASGNQTAIRTIFANAGGSVTEELELAVVQYLCSNPNIGPPDAQHWADMAAFREKRKQAAELEASAQKRAAERRQRIDSIAPVIEAVEDSLKRSSDDAQAATWLWDAGTLWQRFLPGYACPELAPPIPPLAAKYPQYFKRSCCSCESFYMLAHFRELVRRFPDSPLAPEAAYVLTRLPSTGECEGEVDCWIHDGYGPLEGFLRAYPTSSHVPEAVHRANEAFLTALSYRPRPRSLYHFDSTAIRSLVARYDSTAAALPPAGQLAAFRVLGPIWFAFHNEPRAAALRHSVLQTLAPTDAKAYAQQWDSLVTVLTVPIPRRP